MSVTYSFCDNATYTAADVNKITSRLVTGGIADPFTDGVPYNLSAFNNAGALLYTDGVVPENNTSLKVVAEEDGTVTILPGTAFFPDGAVIEVEAGGHTLTPVPGVKNYVYLKNDLVHSNTCFPVVSTEEPGENTVLLCEISEAGEITDKRTYARGKLPGYASVANQPMTIDITVKVEDSTCEDIVLDIGHNNYSVLTVFSKNDSYHSVGMYFFGDDTYYSMGMYTAEEFMQSNRELFLVTDYKTYMEATVSLNDGILTLHTNYRSQMARDDRTYKFTIYLA